MPLLIALILLIAPPAEARPRCLSILNAYVRALSSLVRTPIVSAEEEERFGVPGHIRALNKTWPRRNGPNCFNGVLLWHLIDTAPRFIDRYDFDEVLSQHFSDIPSDTVPEIGDVIVVREAFNGSAVHAMIYIDEKRIWNKNGKAWTGRWEYSSYVPEDLGPFAFETRYRPKK